MTSFESVCAFCSLAASWMFIYVMAAKGSIMGFIGGKRSNDPLDSEYEPHGNHCAKGCSSHYNHSGPCNPPYRTAAPGAPAPSKQAFLKFTCSKIESRIEGVFIVTFTCDESAFPKIWGGTFSSRELVVELNVPPTYAVGRSYHLALPEPS